MSKRQCKVIEIEIYGGFMFKYSEGFFIFLIFVRKLDPLEPFML